MQKQAPTLGRLVTMVLFALSCFGLLLFLWLSFGGPIPLKPKGYRFQVAIPEANQLAVEATVRASGVEVGKIRDKKLAPGGDKTLVTVELDRRFAPLDADARVIQRAKTLLGEKYLEITAGKPGGPKIPEGGRLPDAQVQETVELDEILNALDEPTQEWFQTWQQDMGKAVRGRGQDLNDAFGNLPRWTASGKDVLTILDAQEGAVQRLIKNTGEVFAAITEREDQLHNLITSSDDVFGATARQKEALADTFSVFPTFLDESKLTAEDLESFSRQTRPLLRDLRPALQDLRPTLDDVRALAPDLKLFYQRLDPLIDVSEEGLPAAREILRGLKPTLAGLQGFLEQFNPLLEWLEYNQHNIADFIQNGGGALVDTVPSRFEWEIGHYLGQFGMTGRDSVVINPTPPASDRGNAYPDPTMLTGRDHARYQINASWECDHAGGVQMTEKSENGNTDDAPSCWVKRLPGLTRFPHITAADYSKGRDRVWPPGSKNSP